MTERHRHDERDDADDPAERVLLVGLERDQALAHRQRQDESGRGERQQEHVAVSEIPLAGKQLLAEPRTDQRRRRGSREAQADHDRDELAHTDPEVVVLALAGERGELREQRGLHRLEHEEGNPGDEQPGDEVRADVLLARAREMGHAEDARVRQQLREHRPDQQPRQRARELRVGRVRPGQQEVVLAAERDEHGEQRRRCERDAPRTDRVRSDREQHDASDDADGALGAVHEPVRAEAAVARQRSPGDEGDVVERDRDEQAADEDGPAVEEVVDDRAVADRARHRDRQREEPAEERGAPHDGAATLAAGPARGDRPAHLLFERLEQSGREHEHQGPEHVERVVVVAR